MDDLARRVLTMFLEVRDKPLDLHALFEAGGNDPALRARVLDVVDELVSDGLLQERGSDYYALTEQGRQAATVG
jgi:hypothetical protein